MIFAGSLLSHVLNRLILSSGLKPNIYFLMMSLKPMSFFVIARKKTHCLHIILHNLPVRALVDLELVHLNHELYPLFFSVELFDRVAFIYMVLVST